MPSTAQTPSRPSPRPRSLIAALCALLFLLSVASADIVRYDTGATIPHTQGLTPAPDADLSNDGKGLNLSHADLAGFDLSRANLSRANLSHAHFYTPSSGGGRGGGAYRPTQIATVTDANFSQANVSNADFEQVVSFTKSQLESTRSFSQHNLTGITLNHLDLSGWNFAAQNLAGASFEDANLTNTNFSGANIQHAIFEYADGLTSAQLYSTASFQKRNLAGISLYGQNLTGWNFARQNLTNAAFSFADLASADFAGSAVTHADFWGAINFSFAQLASSRSFQTRNLSGINLSSCNLTGWNLTGQNLTNADLTSANLTSTDLRDAVIKGATFNGNMGFTIQQLCSTASYRRRNLAQTSLEGVNFIAADFSGFNLSHSSFLSSVLSNTDFTSANLADSTFEYGSLDGANFARCNLTRSSFRNAQGSANFTSANLTYVDFTRADFTLSDLQDAVITQADFSNATGLTLSQFASTRNYRQHNLANIHFDGLDLTNWNFAGQNLTNADFSTADMTNADFTGARIAGATFQTWEPLPQLSFAQLQSTADYARHNLAGIHFIALDLSAWDFSCQNLRGTTLEDCNFTSANLTDADIKKCSFAGATGLTVQMIESTASFKKHNLSGINFESVDFPFGNFQKQDLSNSNFFNSDLSCANFASANLRNTDFTYANLQNANLSGADLRGTDFSNVDLRGATGALNLSHSVTTNTILPNGSVHGFTAGSSAYVVFRDGTPQITIQDRASFDFYSYTTIDLTSSWLSPLWFDPGIPISLDGGLYLSINAPDVDPFVGKTFQIFAWNTTLASDNQFRNLIGDSRVTWDLSNFYTTGTVTITGLSSSASSPQLASAPLSTPIPEPASLLLLTLATPLLLIRRRGTTAK